MNSILPGVLWCMFGVCAVLDWWALWRGQRVVEKIAKPGAMLALIGVVALVVIASFAVFGQRILDYLHISVAALQGAGGLLLLIVALQLLTGEESEQHADAGVNVALVPLGTPLLAGPGAIVATMLAMQRAQGGAQVASVFLALAAVLLITWLTFRYAGALLRLLRESGIVLLSRIAGLLLSAIAVQMIADSVRAFIEA